MKMQSKLHDLMQQEKVRMGETTPVRFRAGQLVKLREIADALDISFVAAVRLAAELLIETYEQDKKKGLLT